MHKLLLTAAALLPPAASAAPWICQTGTNTPLYTDIPTSTPGTTCTQTGRSRFTLSKYDFEIPPIDRSETPAKKKKKTATKRKAKKKRGSR